MQMCIQVMEGFFINIIIPRVSRDRFTSSLHAFKNSILLIFSRSYRKISAFVSTTSIHESQVFKTKKKVYDNLCNIVQELPSVVLLDYVQ